MVLTLTTAGESHGPALVGIVTGLPAGLGLDRAVIEADLHRRQQGYGRSPRQQIETDTLEVLLGQGAASFELWTGIQAPVPVMRAALAL